MVIDVTMKLLAMELNISVDCLISYFANIGINKNGLDCVNQEEKKALFIYINHNQQQVRLNKLTLQRKVRSTLNVFGSGRGISKKVQIEIRKKHIFTQRNMDVFHGKSKEIDLQSKCIFIEKSITDDKSSSLFNEKSVGIANFSTISQKVSKSESSTLDKEKVNDFKEKKVKEKNNKSVKSNEERESSIKNFRSDYKKIIKHAKNISDVSSVVFNKNEKIESNRKKIHTDRRFRIRQKSRSFKLRSSSKVGIDIQYKKRKSGNYHLNEMKYEYDELQLPRGTRNSKQRKSSILTHAFNKPTQIINRDVVIGEMITVSELANRMAVKSSEVIKMIMQLGGIVTINQVIDQETAQLVAEEMGHHVILHRENYLEDRIMNDRYASSNITSNVFEYRAPVVTIMGHVDHGKTSLLDYIRSSRVVDSEVGGITQHIGAYCVEVKSKKMITFLDTPGHAAFTAMRVRGVQITDIVILIVAVDDGVMLQTIEAIQHVRAAKVPMIVALNKIDKANTSDIDRIRNDLAQQDVISEEWGGDVQFIPISAKYGDGVDNLLNAILLESELLELKVAYNGMASAVVIESYLDKGRGPIASILVREGTLRCGDVVLCGLEYGRIRAMRNEAGVSISLAVPSMPVEVFGLSGPPLAGDLMVVVRDERKAREVALYRQGKFHAVKLAKRKKKKLKNILVVNNNENNVKLLKLNVVLKADLQGSVEVITDFLKGVSSSDVDINIVDSGVGRINETDVSLAIATHSILLAFNVRGDVLTARMIESENLKIYYHSIIYDLMDDVKKLIDSMLTSSRYKMKSVALAEVRDVFHIPKLGNIAGCMILEGIVRRHNMVRVSRKKVIVHEGKLESLRRFKDDVNEVRSGMECGIVIKNYTDIHLGDLIEIFEGVDFKKK